jgi:hypothetical protein
MKKTTLKLFAAGPLLAIVGNTVAATHYVDVNSTISSPPYTNWATAATNIQDAVDAAVPGDEITVTNGRYNRVSVGKPLSLRSVNGPESTIIDGGGSGRCVYLTNGASLSGFTLTNGFVYGNAGGGLLCGSGNSVVSNCVVTRCRIGGCCNGAFCPTYGAGVSGGSLYNCTLSLNGGGGPSCGGVPCGGLNGPPCYGLVVYGGGAANCTLNNCTLTGNGPGGGAYASTLNNCILNGNSGYAAANCTLNNCALMSNSGVGASSCLLTNCTLTGNSGGGAWSCTLANCIAYFNTGSNYDSSSTLKYCCTTPLPSNGVGNISSDPQLASAFHLSALSPCIGKGSSATARGTDIDGEAWANPPSMGCDEYHAGAVTGPLGVAISASFTSVTIGYPVSLTALIEGRTDLSVWDFGDGALEINHPFRAHSWTVPGDYPVSLWAFNESLPDGISATVTVHVVTGLHYVAASSTRPTPPYTSWAAAATNIQDAINVTEPGGQVVVSNGTYAPITASNSLSVRSVKGAAFTIIDGGQSNRCAFLGSNDGLIGFTLTNGAPHGYDAGAGGGAYGGTLSNCVLIGNSGGGAWECVLDNCSLIGNWTGLNGGGAAYCTLNNCTLSGNLANNAGGGAAYCALNNCALTGNSGLSGGGASGCTLNNCTVTGNSGGGAEDCTLNNCTLIGNSATISGGGAYNSTLNNSIVYFNTAPTAANYGYYPSYERPLNYCCTTPLPTNGAGNITNVPLFVDTNGWANLRLQSNSPCINAGKNAYAPAGTDLDGNPRIKGGTVDMGAYEFQSPTSIISYAWLQRYGLSTDGLADFADPDGDGMNNWQEWVCGTDPANALSALRLLTPVAAGTNVTVTWQSVYGINYFLERSTNLSASPAFVQLAANIPGQSGTTSFTDTNALGAGPSFYRVGVGTH